MKNTLVCLLAALVLAADGRAVAQGTAFTYQGRLSVGGAAANGSYDIAFTLYPTNVTGSALAGPVTNTAVAVTNGLFTTLVDLGPGAFTGTSNWLALAVSTNGANSFSPLAPRQQVTPTPYALMAATAGSVAAADIAGTLPAAALPASVITNGATGVNITGTFSGSGVGLTNVALLGNGAVTWGHFTPATRAVGATPTWVVTADVNGDGLPDLICANPGDNTLTVLTNAGGGSLVPAGTNTVGSFPRSVVAADVNGDGRVDLICANGLDDTLTVLTNDSHGKFVQAGVYAVGHYPAQVTAADVNGDGHVDLICANSGSATLTVLTNDGGGNFAPSGVYSVGGTPYAVVAADVNGDGWVDLISANFTDNNVTVLLNNGSGGYFGNTGTYPVGVGPGARWNAGVRQ